jgi:hypothetical protein
VPPDGPATRRRITALKRELWAAAGGAPLAAAAAGLDSSAWPAGLRSPTGGGAERQGGDGRGRCRHSGLALTSSPIIYYGIIWHPCGMLC